jgi:hypothetical protein
MLTIVTIFLEFFGSTSLSEILWSTYLNCVRNSYLSGWSFKLFSRSLRKTLFSFWLWLCQVELYITILLRHTKHCLLVSLVENYSWIFETIQEHFWGRKAFSRIRNEHWNWWRQLLKSRKGPSEFRRWNLFSFVWFIYDDNKGGILIPNSHNRAWNQ